MSTSLESNRKPHNDPAFLLILAIADNALFHYKSLDARTSSFWFTRRPPLTDESMSKAAFLAIYEKTLKNAGYLCGTSIHAIRWQLGKKVDGENSIA